MNTDRYRVEISDSHAAHELGVPYRVLDATRRDALGEPVVVFETADLLLAYQHADTLNGWGVWPVDPEHLSKGATGSEDDPIVILALG